MHETDRRLTATPSLRAQRIATTTLFGLDGLVFGSWAVRIMQLTGMLCARLGAGAVSAIAAVLTSIAIALPGAAGSVPELAAIVLVFGAATGMLNVSVNAVGVRIERAAGRGVVSSLHAAFSIGGLAGAVLTALLPAHLSVSTHLLGLGVAGLVTASAVAPVLLAGDERVFRGTRAGPLPTATRSPRPTRCG